MFKSLLVLLLSWPIISVQATTPNNTLVIAQSLDDAVSFDPAQGFELSTVQAFNSLYQRLLQSDPSNPANLMTVLASQWQIGSDNHSLIFTLSPGAKFASGNPVRPEDVIFSLLRVVTLNQSPAFLLTQLGWRTDNIASYLQKLTGNQIKISWPNKLSPGLVLSLLSAPVSSIVDEKLALQHQQDGDLGHQWLGKHSAGSGPYQIRQYIPHQVLLLSANPKAPGGAPKIATVLIKNVPEPATRRLLLEQGDVDIARNLGADQFRALSDKKGINPLAVPIASLYFLQFNTQANTTLHNPLFWQAARYLFDYQGISKQLLNGQFSVHQSFLPKGYSGALLATPYHYDPEKARAMLAKAQLQQASFTLLVNNQPPYLDIAQALQASFAKAGVQIKLQTAISSEVSNKVSHKQFQAVLSSWGPDYFDPNTNAMAFAYNPEDGSQTLAARSGWISPKLNQQILAAQAEVNQQKRLQLYRQLQQELLDQSPYVIGLQAKQLIALRDNLTGYQQGVNPDMVYYNKVSKH